MFKYVLKDVYVYMNMGSFNLLYDFLIGYHTLFFTNLCKIFCFRIKKKSQVEYSVELLHMASN